jgi:hypothetical protein
VVLLITGPAYCSGVLIDDQGTVATAYHCVASGHRSRVLTRDGHEHRGKVLAARPRDDLALLSVPSLAGKLRPLQVRDEAPPQGERVYGLGHPFAPAADRTDAMEGMLLWSVTEGIVSAVGPRLIQTDAALNPGNSGGPVVDAQGRVVGITSRKLGGDNIAFLASAEALSALVADPGKPQLVGGHWQLGVALIQSATLNTVGAWQVTSHVVLRDRLVLGGGASLSSGARSASMEVGTAWSPQLIGEGLLRQRFGTGGWSSTLDVGGGAVGHRGWSSTFDAEAGRWTFLPETPRVSPAIIGRFGLSGIGVRVISTPPLRPDELWGLLLSLDIDAPGVRATF